MYETMSTHVGLYVLVSVYEIMSTCKLCTCIYCVNLHVHVHIQLFMYTDKTMSTCTCMKLWVHVHVCTVYTCCLSMYMYIYNYSCTCTWVILYVCIFCMYYCTHTLLVIYICYIQCIVKKILSIKEVNGSKVVSLLEITNYILKLKKVEY